MDSSLFKDKDVILQRILSFTYDDKLPGELLLAGEFKVARGTIKQAIDSLASIGMVYREQGKGTFINRDALQKYYTDLPDVLTSFAEPGEIAVEVLSLISTMADRRGGANGAGFRLSADASGTVVSAGRSAGWPCADVA